MLLLPSPMLVVAAIIAASVPNAYSINITPPSDLYSSIISTKLQTTTNLANYNDTFPQITNRANPAKWQYLSPDQWTAGFFPATMYEMNRRQTLCPAYSDGVDWLSRGRTWSQGLVPLSNGNSQGHDQGFLSFPFVAELAINPTNASAIAAVNKFANILAARFNANVGCTRSWDTTDPTLFEVIIDNMINIDLLFTSANLTGNATLANIAITHADTTMKNHFRGNFSTWHVIEYNATTGAVIAKVTSQGYADWSTWSRGQSWAMFGYASMYNRTGYQRYLDTARAASKLYLTDLPTSTYVPPWDFNAPGTPATADTSAGAIAAAALINLSTLERSIGNTTGSDYYVTAAVNILNGISNLGWKPTWDSLLSNGTANYPAASYQTGIVYGDYYYIKAGNDLIANGFVDCSYLQTSTPITSATSTSTATNSAHPSTKSNSASRRYARPLPLAWLSNLLLL